jgi:hypothetical protein
MTGLTGEEVCFWVAYVFPSSNTYSPPICGITAVAKQLERVGKTEKGFEFFSALGVRCWDSIPGTLRNLPSVYPLDQRNIDNFLFFYVTFGGEKKACEIFKIIFSEWPYHKVSFVF